MIREFSLNALVSPLSGQTNVHPNAFLSALYPKGAPSSVVIVRTSQGEVLADVLFDYPQDDNNHIIIEAGRGVKSNFRLLRMARQFKRHGFFLSLVGLGGTMDKPAMVVPLRPAILNYVYAAAFRGKDHLMKVWLKRLAGFLSRGLAWRGPLVLVASREPETFGHFTLLTSDRKISFLFRDSEATPWAVSKSGVRDELIAEYRNHCRAVEILGQRVPALLGVTEHDTTASITLEAVPECFLSNVVASTLWGKKKVFIREALGHLGFCCEIYRHMAEKGGMEQHVVSAEDINGLVEGIDDILRESREASRLKKALSQTVGTVLPKLMQHGDLCVRNILIADGERDRVLIDWEDLEELRWPLVDYVLLRLSLKEVYADLFDEDLQAMEGLAPLADGLVAIEADLIKILDMEPDAMRAAQLLSLASLCRQNLTKGRRETAMAIFRELMICAGRNPGASELRE